MGLCFDHLFWSYCVSDGRHWSRGGWRPAWHEGSALLVEHVATSGQAGLSCPLPFRPARLPSCRAQCCFFQPGRFSFQKENGVSIYVISFSLPRTPLWSLPHTHTQKEVQDLKSRARRVQTFQPPLLKRPGPSPGQRSVGA